MGDRTQPVAATGAASDPWRGRLDIASRKRLAGWSWDAGHPADPVALQVVDNGELVARVLANRHRADLEKAGMGTGRCAFEVRFPAALSPHISHTIHVRRETDGLDVEGSPRVLAASSSFDDDVERGLTGVMESLLPGPALDRALAFMATHTDRLLQCRADGDAQRAERQAHRHFRRRWGPMLPPRDGDTDDPGGDDPGLRALVVDDLSPVAGRDAGSQAILSHMHVLQTLGYATSFVASMNSTPEGPVTDGPAVETLERLGITCYRTPYYASVEEVLRRQAQCFDLIYLHRISNASKYLALARQHCPRARILYSVADLHHLRFARQAEVEDRPELLARSRRLRLEECMAARSADAVLTHSSHEAALLQHAIPGVNVHVVPWAIPMRQVTAPLALRNGVAFIGGYAHGPNVDAARFLAEEIMPLVWQSDPWIMCYLVGSDMPESVRRLAGPGLRPVGQVADLAEVFDRVRLTVAPLRYGAGVKGKVLASLAAGVPCVMSPVAAEGIELSGALLECVGSTAADIAARIVRLHAETAAHDDAVKAGLQLIETWCCDAVVSDALKTAIESRNQRTWAAEQPRVTSDAG